MTNKNTGKPSQDVFEGLFLKYGKRAFIHRITDTAEVRGMTGMKGVHTKAQPSDYLVTCEGEMFYAEVKSSIEPKHYKHTWRKGQKLAAVAQTAAGGKYFFFVHSLALNKWFRIPAQTIINATRLTFPWQELESYVFS